MTPYRVCVEADSDGIDEEGVDGAFCVRCCSQFTVREGDRVYRIQSMCKDISSIRSIDRYIYNDLYNKNKI